jgi:predicted regulator of Ras-like GTPase activity (Roadblock/LC7/MglB family)
VNHHRADLDWMLKDLITSVPGSRTAIVLSADGFRVAKYATDDDTADRIAAACSGLQSLAAAIASELRPGGGLRMLVIECGGGFCYLMAAGSGTYLATLAGTDVDPGLMGERMRDLVGRLGEHLASPPRPGIVTA